MNEGNSAIPGPDSRPASRATVVVAARIVARRRYGELVADIGHHFNMTPVEVLNVLRDAERTERIAP